MCALLRTKKSMSDLFTIVDEALMYGMQEGQEGKEGKQKVCNL